jgi:hypothetical protein
VAGAVAAGAAVADSKTSGYSLGGVDVQLQVRLSSVGGSLPCHI